MAGNSSVSLSRDRAGGGDGGGDARGVGMHQTIRVASDYKSSIRL